MAGTGKTTWAMDMCKKLTSPNGGDIFTNNYPGGGRVVYLEFEGRAHQLAGSCGLPSLRDMAGKSFFEGKEARTGGCLGNIPPPT